MTFIIPTNGILVLATRNPCKINDFRQILSDGYSQDVIDLTELENRTGLPANSLGHAPEDGFSYEDNAAIGVNEIVEALQSKEIKDLERYYIVSDDSGLELEGVTWKSGEDIVNGQSNRLTGQPFPGIHTKRFWQAQPGETDLAKQNCAFAFYNSVTSNVRCDQRIHAVSVLALKQANETTDSDCKYYRGELEGTLVYPPKGREDFDYDRVFQPKGHEQTLAEMSPEDKNKMNHRRKAFDLLAQHLENDNSAPNSGNTVITTGDADGKTYLAAYSSAQNFKPF